MTFEMLTPENEVLSEVIWGKATGITKGAAIRAADDILEHFILVPRSELPDVSISDHGNGFVTALAQERYQPQLRLHGLPNTGEWSRKIAYANLAVAEAVEAREAREATDGAKLEQEALKLHNTLRTHRDQPTIGSLDHIDEDLATGGASPGQPIGRAENNAHD